MFSGGSSSDEGDEGKGEDGFDGDHVCDLRVSFKEKRRVEQEKEIKQMRERVLWMRGIAESKAKWLSFYTLSGSPLASFNRPVFLAQSAKIACTKRRNST